MNRHEVSLPKAIVAAVLMAALSAMASYQAGLAGTKEAIAELRALRAGDVALNSATFTDLRATDGRLVAGIERLDREVVQIRLDVRGLTGGHGP